MVKFLIKVSLNYIINLLLLYFGAQNVKMMINFLGVCPMMGVAMWPVLRVVLDIKVLLPQNSQGHDHPAAVIQILVPLLNTSPKKYSNPQDRYVLPL